jgi:hypothetical protein
MQRSSRLGRLLILAGIAAWLGLPTSLAQAQPRKAGPDAGRGGKAPANGEGPPRVSLLRLQVIKPDPGLSDTPAGFPRRHQFGFEDAPREGTTLTLLLDEPQRWIVSLEAKDCTITKFRDDKNTDLALANIPPEGDELPLDPQRGPVKCSLSAEVDAAGHHATVTVHSPRVPASGANRLLLDADLVVKYGRGERLVEQKDVNLKVDKITVGPSPLVVMSQVEAG